MTDINVHVFTGRTGINEAIASELEGRMVGFGVVFTSDPTIADIIITTVDYIKVFAGKPILLLSDSIDNMLDNENVYDFTPFPIVEDDMIRLEFRLIKIASDLRDER